jgi:transcriptional regulator GlxA family with amidase domain
VRRHALTHADELANRYPAVTVDPNVFYLDEGRVLTSAGKAAGADLCLHVVRRDHGAAAANKIARHLVTAPRREGGQAQYITGSSRSRPTTTLRPPWTGRWSTSTNRSRSNTSPGMRIWACGP